MREFELFLDESGEFDEKDLSQNRNPSLIGGILVKKNTLTCRDAIEILGEHVHISEQNKEIMNQKSPNCSAELNEKIKKESEELSKLSLSILRKIQEINAKIVIFENFERIQEETSKDLYFKMMCEGITNLLERLSLESPEEPLELSIIAAQKVRDNKQKFKNGMEAVWQVEDYSDQIMETIKMNAIKNNLFLVKNCKINFHLKSANLDQRLMMCDVVCNTYITRTSNKFNKEQKKEISEIYGKTDYLFKINKSDFQSNFSKAIFQKDIVKAIFLAYEANNRDKNFACNSIVQAIEKMSTTEIKIQNDILILKIEEILKIQGNMNLAENFIKMIDEQILSKIKKESFEISKLKLDIELHLLAVYTHQGKNILSEEQIYKCEKSIEALKGNISYFEYYSILSNRKSVFYMDCLAYDKAIKELNNLVEKNKILNNSLMAIGIYDEKQGIKSESLGKALGSRLQALTNKVRQDKTKQCYMLAIKDWEEAVQAFSTKEDVSRQCIYRSNLEVENFCFDDALYYLEKSLIEDIEKNSILENIGKLLKNIEAVKGHAISFYISQYVKIMGEAKKNGNDELADLLFKYLKSNNAILSEIDGNKISTTTLNGKEIQTSENKQSKTKLHPYELIYFNYGIYFEKIDKEKAINFFNKAIKVCENHNAITLDIFKIAIKCEQYKAFKNRNVIDEIIEITENIYSKYFAEIEKIGKSDNEYPTNTILDNIIEYIEILKNEESNIDFAIDCLIEMIRI